MKKHSGFTGFAAQHGQIGDLDAIVLSQHYGLSLGDLCCDLGNDGFFIFQIETHESFSPIKPTNGICFRTYHPTAT